MNDTTSTAAAQPRTGQAPTAQQRKYLGLLLARAHLHGVPYLPIEQLSRAQASDWIDYLKTVVGEEEQPSSPGAYLRTPALRQAPAAYRPPYQETPEAFDHEHTIDSYLTADNHEITYCTLCGGEW